MNTLLEITIVAAWMVVSVAAVTQAIKERRRWQRREARFRPIC